MKLQNILLKYLDDWNIHHMQDPTTIINEETIWNWGPCLYTLSTSHHQISTKKDKIIYHNVMLKYTHTLG